MGRASSLQSGATRGLWGGGQPNPPLPWAVPLSSRARPWHRGGSTSCTPRVTLPNLPWHGSCKRSGLAGSTEAAHTMSGAAPAARKAVVSDGVSNCMRGRVSDRSRAALRWGVGQLPVCPARQCSERLGALLQKRCWANWGSWWVACSSVIRMWGAGKRARDFPSAPRMQTGMKTPWRCLMEPQPWLGREGQVRLAGAGTRDAEPRHGVQAHALPHQLWELRTLGNGGLSPPGPAQHTNRQCLWEGLWG